MKRLYYRDSYGRWHEDRRSERPHGMPARFAVIALLVFAGLVIFASLLH
jgi:hypothetical protein